MQVGVGTVVLVFRSKWRQPSLCVFRTALISVERIQMSSGCEFLQFWFCELTCPVGVLSALTDSQLLLSRITATTIKVPHTTAAADSGI
jgi:hypothetical protein